MNETKKSKAQRTKVANNDTATKNISKRKTLKNSGQESKLVKENLSIILSHSNATPIVRTVRDTMYRCAYCLQDFDMPKELKNHISSTHQNDLLLYLNRFNSLYNMCANLDVTDLKCRLCHDKCKLVEDLLSHLSVQHSIHTDKDVTNRMFQFDFSTADLNCVNCGSNFHSFKSLLEHMNKHSRNFICEDCGASYVTVSKLLTHQKYTHDIGTYPCDECGLVFDTISKRINHKKRHLAPMPKHKCQYCSQKFFLISECRKHAMEVHEKAVVNTAKCPACDAAFSTMSAMSRHKRKVHLMERNNVCQFCNMAFFSKLGLKHHMIKHTGAKDFECQVCHKKYGRKSTLQAHMRIHMNDRRFKCDKCGLAFVQKCSWKSHMRSKHNEMV